MPKSGPGQAPSFPSGRPAGETETAGASSTAAYDYERLVDLTARIERCAHEIEVGLPERTPAGNAAALRLSWQIEEDVKELRGILAERQRSIEAGR